MFFSRIVWGATKRGGNAQGMGVDGRTNRQCSLTICGGREIPDKIARRSVSRVLSPSLPKMDGHSSGTFVAERLARPTRATARKHACGPKPDMPPLFGLAPGVVYPATAVTGGAVRSYRTLSPLPSSRRRFAFCGTFPGVAPAGRYPAPCFRGARTFLPPTGFPIAERRPSDRLDRRHTRSKRLTRQPFMA